MSCEEYMTIARVHKDTCLEAFLAHTERVEEWRGKYLVYALPWNDHDEAFGHLKSGLEKWPHVWIEGEVQPVLAALWDTRVAGLKLVAVWTMSLEDNDENTLFHLDGDWEQDAVDLVECEGNLEGIPQDVQESFCVSDVLVKDDLYCPVLEGIGPKKAHVPPPSSPVVDNDNDNDNVNGNNNDNGNSDGNDKDSLPTNNNKKRKFEEDNQDTLEQPQEKKQKNENN